MVLEPGIASGSTSRTAIPAIIPMRTGTGAREWVVSVVRRLTNTDIPRDDRMMTATARTPPA